MTGAFDTAFDSAFDVGASSDPLPGVGGVLGGGIVGWGKRLQYLALTSPLLIPAAPVVVPDLVALEPALAPRARRTPPGLWTGPIDAPAAPIPDLVALQSEPPVRRKFAPVGDWTRPVEPPAPPPPAPDSGYGGSVDLIRARTRPIPEPQPPILPPGYPPPEWYPRAPEFLRRKVARLYEQEVRPPERPTVPFNPEQQAATYPQPPGPKALLIRLSPVRFLPPAPFVPPSIQPLANPVSWWSRWPDGKPPGHRPRQGVSAAPQNHVPIPPSAPPDQSWVPSMENPVRRKFVRPGLHAGPIDPISTPALISSMWQGDRPHVSAAKRFLTALQQAEAAPGPIIEVLVQAGPWRGEAPSYLRTLVPQQPLGALVPPIPSIISEGVPCIELTALEAAYSTLLSSSGTASGLVSPALRYSTLLNVEVC